MLESFFDSACQKFERIDYAFGGGHSRLSEISVEEFDCVGEEEAQLFIKSESYLRLSAEESVRVRQYLVR